MMLAPAKSEREKARTSAAEIMQTLEATSNDFRGHYSLWIGTMNEKPQLPRFETSTEANAVCRHINDVFDRLRYTVENADAALTFRDGVPVLLANGGDIDHEVLFRLGRKGRP